MAINFLQTKKGQFLELALSPRMQRKIWLFITI